MKEFGIPVELEKTIRTEGKELTLEYEKNICLETIDDEWKDHLRELDELKQSANNAVFEQKDPLLIYKLESFKLYQSMISRMNDSILSTLFKTKIATQDSKAVQETKQPQRTDMSKMQLTRTDENTSTSSSNNENPYMNGADDGQKLSRADRRKQERLSKKK